MRAPRSSLAQRGPRRRIARRSLPLILGVLAFVGGTALLFRLSAEIGSSLGRDKSPAHLVVGQASAPPTASAARYVASIRSPVILIAGDIAECSEPDIAARTAALIEPLGGLVMTAGDNAYPDGSASDYGRCYEPTWGRLLRRTRPVPGNHDYATPGATGYFDYFEKRAGPAGRGYYAFHAGSWRVIALNSQDCFVDGCGLDSEQRAWLIEELATHASACTLAVTHHPRFSSGQWGDNPEVAPLFEALYQAGVDVIVNGHDHDYERLAPARPDGRVDDSQGIRGFVVGTGGAALRPRGSGTSSLSEVFDASTHGVLRLRLHPGSYEWQFMPVAGGTFVDAGTGRCHGRP